jgi:hypothetical protein
MSIDVNFPQFLMQAVALAGFVFLAAGVYSAVEKALGIKAPEPSAESTEQ